MSNNNKNITPSRSNSIHELQDLDNTTNDDEFDAQNFNDPLDTIDDDGDFNIESVDELNNLDPAVYAARFEGAKTTQRSFFMRTFITFLLITAVLAGLTGILFMTHATIKKKSLNNNNTMIEEKPVIKWEDLEPYQKRDYLYISRHEGTTSDFKYMSSKLNLTKVQYLNPHKLFSFLSSKDEYHKIVSDGSFSYYCDSYDAIFVSDSLADSWGLFMDSNTVCNSTIVFVTTNRFDIGIREEDKKSWFKDFDKTINKEDNNLRSR